MNDIEKVIEGLEYCSRGRGGSCISCPGGLKCWCDEAIKLIKKQEAVKPEWNSGRAFCGKCGQPFPKHRRELRRFCSYCGQEVRWE